MIQETKKSVLVVDDEEDTVRFLRMVLEDAGFEVITAFNGADALRKVREKKPDLISLDIVMPNGGGIRCFRELKKNPEWMRIPVIVVTAHARDDLGRADFKEMTMSGPGVYLEKPVTAESYVNAVCKILGIAKRDTRADIASLKDEAKSLIDSADPDVLRRIVDAIKGTEAQ